MSETVPPGFEPLFRSSPFLDLLGPLFNKRDSSGLVVGFRVADKHCNARGFVHGGVLSSLADIALGYSAAFMKEPAVPLVTASLSIDYAGSARIGDWVDVISDVQKVGSTMAFANCYFVVNDRRIARASGVFGVVKSKPL